jgi:serine/threonine-protein kinase
LRDAVLKPSAVVPSLPTAFDAPLLRALSRDATKRHATARELAFELEKCVGVATASEVGEWVENMVGPILSAREDQIAQIESNSASIRVSPSGRPESTSDSDTDIPGLPSSRAGTLMGVGAPSSSQPMQSSGGYPAAAPSSARGAPPSGASTTPAANAGDEGTGSKVTGSRFTGTMTLPIDKKLPLLASAVGLIVLLLIVGFVIAGRETETGAATATAASASASASALAAARGEAALSATGATSATGGPGVLNVPEPAPSVSATSSAAPVDSAQPGIDVKPLAVATPPASPPPATTTHATPGHTITRPPTTTPPTTPTVAKTAAVAPAPRKNCDPPYTLDASGHKKYKLECM